MKTLTLTVYKLNAQWIYCAPSVDLKADSTYSRYFFGSQSPVTPVRKLNHLSLRNR